MERTEDDIVQLGNFGEHTLASAEFNSLYDEFRNDRFNWMMGSAPHETKKREGIYAEMNAIGEFMSLMKSYVTKRDELLNKDEQSIADDSDDI